MAAAEPTDREALLDLLFDLQHDLGKYLALPLRFLPRDAAEAEVRQALRDALERTRQGPTGVRNARSLWEGFLAEAGPLRGYRGMAPLEEAVAAALGCAALLEDERNPIDRAAVEAVLARVGQRIRNLIAEVERGG